MINRWRTAYHEYLTHNGVKAESLDEVWCQITNNLIRMWEKMESGELRQIYRSFNHFLESHIDYYERINENYRRDSRKKPVEVVKSNGGRYWL